MRAAVYAMPAPDSALNRLASTWLSGDAFSGAATQPADPARDAVAAEAARYGFHATLRAPFRAPLTADEVARRRAERLTGRQRDRRDGFHMTLTGPVPGPAVVLRAALEAHVAPLLGRPLALDGLGLFVEDQPGTPFRVHGFHPFGPAAAPEPAGTP